MLCKEVSRNPFWETLRLVVDSFSQRQFNVINTNIILQSHCNQQWRITYSHFMKTDKTTQKHIVQIEIRFKKLMNNELKRALIFSYINHFQWKWNIYENNINIQPNLHFYKIVKRKVWWTRIIVMFSLERTRTQWLVFQFPLWDNPDLTKIIFERFKKSCNVHSQTRPNLRKYREPGERRVFNSNPITRIYMQH